MLISVSYVFTFPAVPTLICSHVFFALVCMTWLMGFSFALMCSTLLVILCVKLVLYTNLSALF